MLSAGTDRDRGSDQAVPVLPLAILFDVDNTLYDNDRFSRELNAELVRALGAQGQACYRAGYEALRDARGYADYLSALQCLRGEFETDPDLLQLSSWLLDYPFADRIYPQVTMMLARMSRIGCTAILSDGDLVFQPRKIQRSGIWDAVQGRVLITLHKQAQLGQVRQALPALHYVMVEDKPTLLDAIKSELGADVTTVFVRQGHYAIESVADAAAHPPDLRIDRIGALTPDILLPLLPGDVRAAIASAIPLPETT